MKNVLLALAGVSLSIGVARVSALCPKDANCAGKKTEVTAGGGCAKPCCAGAGGATTENPALQAVLASLPTIKYRVGDKTVCCANGASVMAETEGKPIEYLVGDEAFPAESQAKVRLAALYESEIESLTSLQFSVAGECTRCPVTAKGMAEKSNGKIAYKVGGVEFSDKEKAEATVKLVADAAATVKLSYKVEGKSFCCDKMAGMAAKESGKPIVYIAGEDEAPDELSAKLINAQAKIRAIVEAAASAQAS